MGENKNIWLHPRITVEDSRIDSALLELELHRRVILDLKKQIKNLWIALLTLNAVVALHLLNHLIFM
mgnify:CR=1 FL=1